MKWLLLFTIIDPDLNFEVLKYPMRSEVSCQIEGKALAEYILVNLPNTQRIQYKCVATPQ